MIPLCMTLRITLITAVISYFILILIFLKNKSISLKYTLLWICAGIVMGIMVFFPGILVTVTKFLGIESNMNGVPPDLSFIITGTSFMIPLCMTAATIASGSG